MCYLVCDAGYIPSTKTSMQCRENAAAGKFDWSEPLTSFLCVKACHLVVGGIQNGTK